MEFKSTKTTKTIDPLEISAKMNIWPDCYYREMEPAIRRQLLNEAERMDLTPEDNEIREFLFARRYKPDKNGYVDNYLKPWLEFKFINGSNGGKHRIKGWQKQVRKLFAEMGEPEIRAMGEDAVKLLAREYEQSGLCYITVSREDPSYKSVILGFGTVSDDKLYARLYNDCRIVSETVPERIEMAEELSIWTEAVKRALRIAYPTKPL